MKSFLLSLACVSCVAGVGSFVLTPDDVTALRNPIALAVLSLCGVMACNFYEATHGER